jgi:hypothetical protein
MKRNALFKTILFIFDTKMKFNLGVRNVGAKVRLHYTPLCKKILRGFTLEKQSDGISLVLNVKYVVIILSSHGLCRMRAAAVAFTQNVPYIYIFK